MLKRLEGPIWIVIGVSISFFSQRTGIGYLTEPGAGFVALASGLFLIAIGFVMSMIPKEKGDPHAEPAAPMDRSRRSFRILLTIALLVLYGLLLEPLGYVLTTFLFMAGLFYDLEKRRIAVPLFASFASVAATYGLFEIWLKARFPRGVFPWW
jgi:putative tricarboxylic transport membrane protein